MATTWLATVQPSAASRLLATAPQATFAAVSRALARSITSRMSSRPYSKRSAEVRVAGPRHDHPLRGRLAARGRLHRQDVSPVGGVAVGDEQSEMGAPVVRP